MAPPSNPDPPQLDDNDHDISFHYQTDKRLVKFSFRRKDRSFFSEATAFCIEYRKPIGVAIAAVLATAGVNLPWPDHFSSKQSEVSVWPPAAAVPYDFPIPGAAVPKTAPTESVKPQSTAAPKASLKKMALATDPPVDKDKELPGDRLLRAIGEFFGKMAACLTLKPAQAAGQPASE